ncbi:MAG TPA: DNA polymerase ligase N-terminal domain-containing protein [Gemmatimonadaceae bacterium]|nr:DNA polymerase ligase N-terminal domain-containing protein [Gemmatimonadaceae bacterium]
MAAPSKTPDEISMARREKGDALTEYRRKRDFMATPEPAGHVAARAPHRLRYVIQKHAASQLHFDLRLELGGVMKSWAVPKGPSLDPSVKRLAMEVEDHPIEYNAFEGTIPQGQYGGGTVMLWDVGTYGPEHADGRDPEAVVRAGYEKGDLKIVFDGARLQGSWVLVRMKRPGKPQWLFIKHRDEHANSDFDIVAETPTSVATGRTMEEIGADESNVWESNREGTSDAGRATRGRGKNGKSGPGDGTQPPTTPASRVARRTSLEASSPMLATLADAIPDGPGWTFEPKYDGIRVIALATLDSVALLTRNGNDKAAQFPEIVAAVQRLAKTRKKPLVLDGEIVAVHDGEVARFQALQSRMHVTNSIAIESHVRDTPVACIAFDLLLEGDRGLLGEPWSARRARLERVFAGRGVDKERLRLGETDGGDGARMLDHARASGWEGIIAKRIDAPYRPGVRSRDWLKIKVEHRQVREGATRDARRATRGGRRARGATSAAGDKPEGKPRKAGPRPTPASRVARPASRNSRVLNQLERIEADTGSGTIDLPDGATLKVTSLGKKYFTGPDVTKGAVMRYYVQMADGLLPAITDRPLVLKRMPDGMNGETFFQHRPPSGAPDIMRIADVSTESGLQPRVIGGGIGTVLALVQFGVISMDPWHSRIDSLDEPDYAFLDLDPGPRASFGRVVEVALAVREELESLGLRGVPRTSGSRGMHVALPLPRGLTYDAALVLAQIVATRVAEAYPRLATVERAVKRRADDAIYVDYLQNMRGKSIASVYSVRARVGATVATPLDWDEVSPGLDPAVYTVETVPARYAEVGDLWRAGMRKPNTMRAIKRLAGGE